MESPEPGLDHGPAGLVNGFVEAAVFDQGEGTLGDGQRRRHRDQE
jgi:hypothetical protein